MWDGEIHTVVASSEPSVRGRFVPQERKDGFFPHGQRQPLHFFVLREKQSAGCSNISFFASLVS
jgi:hypothetical protein